MTWGVPRTHMRRLVWLLISSVRVLFFSRPMLLALLVSVSRSSQWAKSLRSPCDPARRLIGWMFGVLSVPFRVGWTSKSVVLSFAPLSVRIMHDRSGSFRNTLMIIEEMDVASLARPPNTVIRACGFWTMLHPSSRPMTVVFDCSRWAMMMMWGSPSIHASTMAMWASVTL